MPIFEIQDRDGKTYEADAPDQAAALEAFKTFQITSPDGKRYRVQGANADGALAAVKKMEAMQGQPRDGINVKGPDGSSFAFPSGTPTNTISQAMQTHYGQDAGWAPRALLASPALSAFRQKYPQYGDMDDATLAGALHQKFYADMPREEFNAKIGLAPQRATGDNSGRPPRDLLAQDGSARPPRDLLVSPDDDVLHRLGVALQGAHAAGDEDAARILAGEIVRRRGTSPEEGTLSVEQKQSLALARARRRRAESEGGPRFPGIPVDEAPVPQYGGAAMNTTAARTKPSMAFSALRSTSWRAR